MMHRLVCMLIIISTLTYSMPHEERCFFKGLSLCGKEQYQEALPYLHVAAMKQNYDRNRYFSFANACFCAGKFNKAIALYTHILQHNPYDVATRHKLGCALVLTGKPHLAIPIFNVVLTIRGLKKETHDNIDANHACERLAFTHMMCGNLAEGYRIHKLFLQQICVPYQNLEKLWRTNQLAGKRILLNDTSLFGDIFQWIRYARVLHNRGAYVVAHLPRAIHTLLKLCPYIDELYGLDENPPDCDASCPLLYMSTVVEDTFEDVTNEAPYLHADTNLVKQWAALFANKKKLHVGVCWHASTINDSFYALPSRRSIPLATIADYLHGIENVQFYSLQQIDGLEEIDSLRSDFPLYTFDTLFDKTHGSFMDTAAVIAHLDMVISADTSIAHLAGAMGKPVLLLFPYITDWRWIMHGTTQKWYPTLQLYKQPKAFDWASVLQQVRHTIINKAIQK